MSDPRLIIIPERFKNVKNIIAVSSGKGGVGKSMISVSLTLALRDKGYSVGLLDLDFTSPSTHLILGVQGLYPTEEKGITPPITDGIHYMSIVHYSLDNPTPLRGADQSDAIIELLAITRWETLDYLIIDMPPGLGDATLDMLRLIPRINFLVVSTPSVLAFESVKKLLTLLIEQGIPIKGVIENMVLTTSIYIKQEVEKMNLTYLTAIYFDNELEAAIGYPNKLISTQFHNRIVEISGKI
ncbi:ATP-binding protein [Candidatus Bathyarchaeota archaeon]|nr:ATP-binding protein [Candidatus Bathyarchaeota archaeon]